MYEKLDKTVFDLQHESKIHDEFLKTLEEDLLDLRRDIAKLKKMKADPRSQKSPGLKAFDFQELVKEVEILKAVILERSETNRMLHTRLRKNIINRMERTPEGAEAPEKHGQDGPPAEIDLTGKRLTSESKDGIHAEKRKLLESTSKKKTKTKLDHFAADLLKKAKETALNKLIEEFRASEGEKTKRILGKGGLHGDDAERVFQFYIHYAVYTEYFNSMKYLYQILLKEYEELDILDDNVVTELRKKAIFKITALLCKHQWRRPHDAGNREAFRNQLMIEIRHKLHKETPRGLWPENGPTHSKDGKGTQTEHGGLKRPIAALCLSGGGIRSATFSLGIIQGLARLGLLDKFHYMSTVSGGGYIGSWLSAWAYREKNPYHDPALEQKAEIHGDEAAGTVELKKSGVTAVQRKLAEIKHGTPEPPEVTHLRSYSNYMSPRVGLMSVDTWTLVGVYMQNLLLNWMVFVPLIAAFLLLPRLIAEFTTSGQYLIGAAMSPTAVGIGSIGVILGIASLFFINMFRPILGKSFKKGSRFSDKFRRDAEIGVLKNVEPKILALCILPMTLFALCITTYWFCVGIKGDRWVRVQSILTYVNDPTHRTYILTGLVVVSAAVIFQGLFFFYRKKKWETQRNLDRLILSGCCVLYLSILVGVLLYSGEGIVDSDKDHLVFVGTVLFAEILFAAAFISSWSLIYLLSDKHGIPGRGAMRHLGIEFGISFLAATSGGIILYMAARNFDYIYWAVQAFLGQDVSRATIYTIVAVPLFLSVFLIAATIFVGIGSKIMDNLEREWLSRMEAWLLIVAVGWLTVCGLVLLGPKLIEKAGTTFQAWFSLGSISGFITLLFGYYANSFSKDSAQPAGKINILVRLAPRIAAPVFAAFLIVLVTIGTDTLIKWTGNQIERLQHDFYAPPTVESAPEGSLILLSWFGVLLGVGCLMGRWVNVNKFSLHATYRERLIRAYLGATRANDRIQTVNSFTGLDEHDDIEMRELFQTPFHVINMTLNVARTASLRWQTRKAESFTVSPFHCGSSNMGEGSGTYRKSEFYGANKAGSPISLGTAAAISGAAASPNMGYYTQSTFVSVLMALFNVRLGWWLGNPGRRGSKTYHKSCPDFSPRLFFDEAFGMTEDTDPYVYLSDGGHFDNLGLYEMVLRRCQFIVVCDAAADAEFGFSDLGSVIHKIRVDMGIPIVFEPGNLPIKGRNCSVAKIKYSAIDHNKTEGDGILVYIKPTLDGNEPVDIIQYVKKNPDFPHESTLDQMFGETQFESYRSLACHMIDSICGSGRVLSCSLCGGECKQEEHYTLRDFYDHVDSYLTDFGKKMETNSKSRSPMKPKKGGPPHKANSRPRAARKV